MVEFLFGLSVGEPFAGGKLMDVFGVMRLFIVGVLFAAGIVLITSVVVTPFRTPLLVLSWLTIVVDVFVVVVTASEGAEELSCGI